MRLYRTNKIKNTIWWDGVQLLELIFFNCQNQDHSKCPIREMLTRLGDKWSILIIYTLSQAPA